MRLLKLCMVTKSLTLLKTTPDGVSTLKVKYRLFTPWYFFSITLIKVDYIGDSALIQARGLLGVFGNSNFVIRDFQQKKQFKTENISTLIEIVEFVAHSLKIGSMLILRWPEGLKNKSTYLLINISNLIHEIQLKYFGQQ